MRPRLSKKIDIIIVYPVLPVTLFCGVADGLRGVVDAICGVIYTPVLSTTPKDGMLDLFTLPPYWHV